MATLNRRFNTVQECSILNLNNFNLQNVINSTDGSREHDVDIAS